MVQALLGPRAWRAQRPAPGWSGPALPAGRTPRGSCLSPQGSAPRIVPSHCVLVDSDSFKCILWWFPRPGHGSWGLVLLNQDPVVADPYEEAQGPGERSPPGTAHRTGNIRPAGWPLSLCPASMWPWVSSCYTAWGKGGGGHVLQDAPSPSSAAV